MIPFVTLFNLTSPTVVFSSLLFHRHKISSLYHSVFPLFSNVNTLVILKFSTLLINLHRTDELGYLSAVLLLLQFGVKVNTTQREGEVR